MRFDDRVTGNLKKYAKQATIIHIEIDQAEINKNVAVDVEIHNDAKDVLTYLTPIVKPNSFEKWIREFRICDKEEYEKVIKPEIKPEIVSKEKFTVFPNPFQNNLNIYYTGDSVESETISISDITGKTVYTETWSNVNPGTKQEMNLNALKPGIYFIKITDLKLHIITKKVIKN